MEIQITVLTRTHEEAAQVVDILRLVGAPVLTPNMPQDPSYFTQLTPAQSQAAAMYAPVEQPPVAPPVAPPVPQQPAYMQQPPAQPQQPAYMQPPVAPPVYGQQPPVAPPAPQQPAYMQQPPAQNQQPVYMQQPPAQPQQPAYMQQPPQVSAPTGTMDYTHEQLGRAVAPFIDKAPANRQKVQDCLKSLGVESVTQLNTKELRAAYAVALRQLGVQI